MNEDVMPQAKTYTKEFKQRVTTITIPKGSSLYDLHRVLGGAEGGGYLTKNTYVLEFYAKTI